jgi:hypothetical protein
MWDDSLGAQGEWMIRRPFTTLSLLLCVAIVPLWARSYWVWNELEWWQVPREPAKVFNGDDPRRIFRIRSAGGHWSVGWIRFRPWLDPVTAADKDDAPTRWRFDHAFDFPPYGDVGGNVTGLRAMLFVDPRSGVVNSWGVILPFWPPATLLATLPLIAAARFTRRRRLISKGTCIVCGYDLRATPVRCPECGTAPN